MLDRTGKKTLATEARHRIQIQRVTNVSDGEGGFTETWTTLNTVWAAVYPIRAQQRFEYKSIDVEATHYVKVRGYIDITAKDIIVFKGTRKLEVLTVENIQELNFNQFITCKEIIK